MAKKSTGLDDIFKKTEPQEPEQPDKVIPRGIGLKESEWRQLEAIGTEMGTNAHRLIVWAVRDFLRRYEAGELPITEQKRQTLPGL
jgi:hypothetical protein